ncbi:MAG TPA: Coenzyme F420 hydrogenase/dehydrogenase, beta subunit C-terminal domain, partial [bacterium]|nr:Coenzyme F420 hydrogenase/dehydrogenase, beta subunit C-terminal domain [bacterium]
MEKLNVMKTRELDLCTSCEICFAVCSVGAITMEYRLGQFFPTVDEKKCIKCGLCLKLCPGINIMPFIFEHKKVPNNIFDGNYLECYTAYSNDRKIRKNSTSGGLITDLVVGLVKNKEFDGAFVLDFDKLDGKSARLKCTNNIDEIFKSAKSKYIPASVYNIIKTLKERNNNSYIIIGTPCQIWGIKNFIKNLRLSEINLLFLGLFCERTLNFNLIQYFEDMYKKSNEKIVKFEFRTKEKYGWPGNSKLYFNSGRELIVSRNVRMQLKEFFQLNRCLFCVDKLNELADISFGDCYIEGKNDINGRSTVIIRTKKGKEIFDRYSYLFTFEKETIEEIRKSQHLIEKKDNLEYAKILAKKAGLYSNILPDYEIDGRAAKKLLKLQRRIKWGKHYNVHKIRFAFVCSNITKKLKNIERKILLGIASAVIIGEDFFLHWQRKRKNDRKKIAENIIIVGSDLANKGSQAMVFTVVNQIKRAFPNKKIYLFSSAIDFERNEKEKNIYKFNILP